jgi:hypothetical protein
MGRHHYVHSSSLYDDVIVISFVSGEGYYRLFCAMPPNPIATSLLAHPFGTVALVFLHVVPTVLVAISPR